MRGALAAAQAKAAEAEALPQLRADLAASSADVARLHGRERQLQDEAAELREQLAAACTAVDVAAAAAAEQQRSTDELAAAHAVLQQQLRGELQEQQVGVGAGWVGSRGAGRQCACRHASALSARWRAACLLLSFLVGIVSLYHSVVSLTTTTCTVLLSVLQAEVERLGQELHAALAAAEEAVGAQAAAAAAVGAQRERQEGDVAALVEHHSEEVSRVGLSGNESVRVGFYGRQSRL